MSYDKVRAFPDTYRVWDQADMDLERELTELLENAEHGDREAEVIETLASTHVPEPMHTKAGDHLNAIEQLLLHYQRVTKRLSSEQALDLWEPEGVKALFDLLAERDALDVLRSRVVGVVKRAGALDMNAHPDDNRLVILLETLMP